MSPYASLTLSLDIGYGASSVRRESSIGCRESRDVELAASVPASEQWGIAANAADTDAAFKRPANFDRFAANTPSNVPEWTFNLWTSYCSIAGTPAEVGGGALRR